MGNPVFMGSKIFDILSSELARREVVSKNQKYKDVFSAIPLIIEGLKTYSKSK